MDSKKTQKLAAEIVKTLVDAGYTAYFAGGWVRDYVMGHASEDIDIATSAPPEKIVELFPKTIQVGIAFGVVVVIKGGHQFEVSTFRYDTEYDGRRPGKVEYSSAKEDAMRRDFTINGMFFDPLKEEIIDYVCGMQDIEKGIIRTIGNPEERFVEDRLRMIRAVRLKARFGFTITDKTKVEIKKNAGTLFPSVAMERIWQEFVKMTKFPHIDEAILDMHKLGLLAVIFPDLKKVDEYELKQMVHPFKNFPSGCPTILYIMEFFKEAPLEKQLEIALYLKTSVDDQKLVKFMRGAREMLAEEEKYDDVEWAKFYANPNSELCLEVVSANYSIEKRKAFLERHLKRCERLLPHVERLADRKRLITGSMLQEYGIKPGILMGELLDEAQSIAIMRDLHDTESILKILKKSSLWPGESEL